MDQDDLLEVRLLEEENFLKIKETLTRMGIASKDGDKLYQSCHILHKRGKYYITHFKEMFMLDGKTSNISEEDIARRNSIAKLLEEWNLIEIVDEDKLNETEDVFAFVKIIPHGQKSKWQLISKYTVGKKK